MTTASFGNNTGNTYAGCEDAKIVSSAGVQDTNYGTHAQIEATKYGAGDHAHTIIRWTGLSGPGGGVTVSAVSVFLKVALGTGGSPTINLRQVLPSWAVGQVTWNNRSTGPDVPWTAPGCLSNGNDRSATVAASLVINGGAQVGNFQEFVGGAGLIALFQGWMNGAIPNEGVHIERNDAGNDLEYLVFHSNESADGNRPYAVVTFTAGAGGTPTGLASETDTALALTGKQISPTGLATETDTALALTTAAGFDFHTAAGLIFGDLAGALTALARQATVAMTLRVYNVASPGALVHESGTLTTDSAGRLARFQHASLSAGTTYHCVFIRTSDGEIVSAKLQAT